MKFIPDFIMHKGQVIDKMIQIILNTNFLYLVLPLHILII